MTILICPYAVWSFSCDCQYITLCFIRYFIRYSFKQRAASMAALQPEAAATTA